MNTSKMKTMVLTLAAASSLTVAAGTPVCAAEGNAGLTVNADTSALDETAQISPELYGIFLEDINFAVDGGMYAQIIKNGSFEFGALAKNFNKHNYYLSDKENVEFTVADGTEDGTCLNENNPHYAIVKNNADDFQGIGNKGYLKGFAIEEGADYHYSVFLKGLDGYTGPVYVCIDDMDGNILAEDTIEAVTDEWYKYEGTITANTTAEKNLRFWVKIENGSAAIDNLSLFPADTYKGRENGIRKDIGEYLEALKPRFLRFPGGCAVEGTSLDNQYSWKDSIGNGMSFTINGEETVGAVETRPTQLNIWHNSQDNPYYMSYGMGFYEYFLLCEDLNCMPVPILNAGMTCPIQSGDGYFYFEEDSEEFKQYVQDALDLVEFCRGGADTKWGAVRIAMGHEEPFPLHYIGIGNEQWQSEYYSHYERFKEAFAEAETKDPEMYGDLELIIGNGPLSSHTFAWDMIRRKGNDYAGLVDEHYYELPEWFLQNVDRYDSYDRDSVPVFLGEYAAKSNTMEAALAEAAFMTGLEKNADIVKMACYAPLFGNDRSNQWEPDMIFYSNNSVYGTVNYYVQKMYSDSQGVLVLDSELSEATAQVYQVAEAAEDGTMIIKLVNVSGEAKALDITLENAEGYASKAALTVLSAEDKGDANNQLEPEKIMPEESTMEVSDSFTYEMPKYSVTVMKIAKQ